MAASLSGQLELTPTGGKRGGFGGAGEPQAGEGWPRAYPLVPGARSKRGHHARWDVGGGEQPASACTHGLVLMETIFVLNPLEKLLKNGSS